MFLAEGGMTLKIKLLESTADFNRKVEKAAINELKNRIKRNTKRAERQIKNLVLAWALESEEVSSLTQEGVRGSLHAQLGLYAGTGSMIADAIAQSISDGTYLEINIGNRMSDITAIIYFQPVSFSNLLSIPGAEVLTDKGTTLPWMQWLLFEGTRTIITGYKYTPDGSGRSGGGTMEGGGAWRIPVEYAGSVDNNFVTRIFDGKNQQIQPILQGILS